MFLFSLFFYLVIGIYNKSQKYYGLTIQLYSKIQKLFYVTLGPVIKLGIIWLFAPYLVQFILVRLPGSFMPTWLNMMRNGIYKKTPKPKYISDYLLG